MSLTQYLHSSWTYNDGFVVPSVQSLAQTNDGYLWLGTSSGLFRFDGVRFVQKKLPGSGDPRILALAASPNGDLWVAVQSGLVRFDAGQHRAFRYETGLPGPTNRLAVDTSGRVWAATGVRDSDGVVAIDPSGSKEVIPLPAAVRGAMVLTVFADREGGVWVGTTAGICSFSRQRKAARCWTDPLVEASSFDESADGTLLVSDNLSQNILRFSSASEKPVFLPIKDGRSLTGRFIKEHEGNILVVGTHGLVRLHSGSVERFGRKEGLSSDVVNSLLVDREGSVWVGTVNGLDRFREPKIRRISSLEGLSSDFISAVLATRSGDMWAATSGGGVNRLSGGKIFHYGLESGLPSDTVLALYEGDAGRVWVATSKQLAFFVDGRFNEFPTASEPRLDRVFAMTGGVGKLWFSDQRKGLFELRNERIESARLPNSIAGKDISPVHYAPDGTLWVGYFQGGVAAVKNGTTTAYNGRDGLIEGRIQAIDVDTKGSVWVGGKEGLSRYSQGHWKTWKSHDVLPDGGIQAIAEDGEQCLWLMSPSDLLRIPIASFDRAADSSPASLEVTAFGLSEGIRLGGGIGMATQRIAKSTDGRIWFATMDGLAVVDPARLRHNEIPPRVSIESVTVNGAPVKQNSSGVPSFRDGNLRIEYAAPSLASPETVLFRYQLEGTNPSWNEAGTNRSIIYDSLPPGHYRFRVMARNEGNVEKASEASLAFEVQPHFYQTLWFKGTCALLLCLLVWGVTSVRRWHLQTKARMVLEERSRMTRELHDTLLQGFAGVVFQLEAAERQFDSAPQQSRKQLRHALGNADYSLKEARQTITLMRQPEMENSSLVDTLSSAAQLLAEEKPIAIQVRSSGEPYQLPPDVQWNIYVMAREAIGNSVRHANAGRILIEMDYSPDKVILAIEDDGDGFDLSQAMAKANHWGLHGLQERSKQIHAKLAIDTKPGAGTKVTIAIPRRKSGIWKL